MNQNLSNKLKALSFWSIVLVLIIHANNTKLHINTAYPISSKGIPFFVQLFLSQGIAAVAVPIFFGISGYLFFFTGNGSLHAIGNKLTKRLRTLLIPYLFWSMLGLVSMATLPHIPLLKPWFNQTPFANFSIAALLNALVLQPVPYQFWFVLHLSILMLATPLLYLAIRYLGMWFIGAATVAWILNLNYTLLQSESVLFFSLGAYIGLHQFQESPTPRFIGIWALAWLSLVTLKTALDFVQYPHSWIIGVLHKSSIVIGIVTCWFLLDKLAQRRSLTQYRWFSLTPFTFFVFAAHEPLLTLLKKGLLTLGNHNEWSGLIVYAMAPILTFALTLTLGYVLKMQIPRFYGWITGGR
jgi:surface polysaccharide O-acyltransferase-like enzyme